MTQRKSYTAEFKREAIRLANERGNSTSVARDLGIPESLIPKWKKSLEAQEASAFPGKGNPFPGKGNAADPDLAQLKRENTRLKEEVEILKKAVGIFTSHPL